jgi:alanine dehydrogenase
MNNLSIGFPRILKEAGEKRVFLPEFIQFLVTSGATIWIEEGYGSRSGLSFDDYRRGEESVHMGSREEVMQQDILIVLRSLNPDEFEILKPGTVLISMLHYPTRPGRVEKLKNLKIKAISMDSIVDDNNIRLVENMKAVAWNGLEAAFDVLEKHWTGLRRPDGEPIQTLILGTGMVGKHAIEAATKLGNVGRNRDHIQEGGPGALAICVGRNITCHPQSMKKLFEKNDILVDSTQRREPHRPVVPNEWIAWLPEHAVITDLAVDPYTLDTNPPVVRGIEGIPQGNLNQYVFTPDDPGWDKSVPKSIPSKNRRTVVSCYSWPGIYPEACMRHYAQQLEPLLKVLIDKGYDQLSPQGDYFERALYRATLKAWLEHGQYGPRPR